MNEAVLMMSTCSANKDDMKEEDQSHIPTLEGNIIVALPGYVSDTSFEENSLSSEHNEDHDRHELDDDDHQDYCDEELATPEDLGVVFELIERREWDEMVTFVQAVPEAAAIFMAPRSSIEVNHTSGGEYGDNTNINRDKKKSSPILWTCSMASTMSTSPTSTPNRRGASTAQPPHHSGGNLALHEACKYQPPVEAVQALLDAYKDAVKVPGLYGYLPLHFACSSNASEQVVRLLIEAHPAAVRTRDELDEALPIHLAAKWGANDEVLLDILTTHPEGSFIKDASGKTAMDHAKKLPSEVALKNNVITVLQIAPILAKAAHCAKLRLQQEYETKIRGYEQAQKEFVRQLEDRFDEERTAFLQKEIRFNSDLATEKESNISLHEELMAMKQKALSYKDERDDVHELLAKERVEHNRKIDQHDRECKLAMEETMERMKQLEKHIETMKYIEQQAAAGTRRHDDLQKKLTSTKTELQHKDETIRHLHSLLSTKDERIEELEERCSAMEMYHDETASYSAKDVSSANQLDAEEGTDSSRMGFVNIRQVSVAQQNELILARRKIKQLEDRWESVKGLVASLSHIVDQDSSHDKDASNSKSEDGRFYADKGYHQQRNQKLSLPKMQDMYHPPSPASRSLSSQPSATSPATKTRTSTMHKTTVFEGMEHVTKQHRNRVATISQPQGYRGVQHSCSPTKANRFHDPGTPDTVVSNYTSISLASTENSSRTREATQTAADIDEGNLHDKLTLIDEPSLEGSATIETATNTSTKSHPEDEHVEDLRHGQDNGLSEREVQDFFVEKLISNHPQSPIFANSPAGSPARSNGSFHSTISPTPSDEKSPNRISVALQTARENLNVEVQLESDNCAQDDVVTADDQSEDYGLFDQNSSLQRHLVEL